MSAAPCDEPGSDDAPRFARGGIVSRHPDGSDSVPARLDTGFIVPAALVKGMHGPEITGFGGDETVLPQTPAAS
ncbi:MAG: hypothetical protein M3Y33_11445 [Actinomycetota bacterium]|nr:hypothetical protein [Actinomycetota bacterium]